MHWAMSEAATAVGGELVGADRAFERVGSDSRDLAAGSLFVALRGPNFDGHEHVEAAARRGAVGAMVERRVDAGLSQIVVDDTLGGLGRLAADWRARRPATLIGITASNGKTTMKEMLAAILRQRATVLATHGNLNNEIGLPLTLLGLEDERFAVVEMGANHPGEIARLSHIAQPDIALLGNAGRAHLAGFGGEEGVARAKAEIIDGLCPGGLFVYPEDSRWASLWRELGGDFRRLSFGLQPSADVHADAATLLQQRDDAGFATCFDVIADGRRIALKLRVAGRHNVANAVAVCAVALALEIPDAAIQRGLASVEPVGGRLSPVLLSNGALLIDDSYNANPDSVLAAIDVLAGLPGRRTLVLGGLGELGDAAAALHRELGEAAGRAGIDRLFTMGALAAEAGLGFAGGARGFDDPRALVEALRRDMRARDSILVKGSRAAGMERVVDRLREPA